MRKSPYKFVALQQLQKNTKKRTCITRFFPVRSCKLYQPSAGFTTPNINHATRKVTTMLKHCAPKKA